MIASVIYCRVLVKKYVSGVAIQLSGDTFYMSSTLINVMLLFRDILFVFIERGALSYRDSQFLYTGVIYRPT